MPTPVPLAPQESALSRLVVGEPVSARHGARWAAQIAHLLGRQVHRACSCSLPAVVSGTGTSGTKTAHVHYLRSAAAQVALVAIELRDDTKSSGLLVTALGYQVNVTVTAPSGATWIDRGSPGELLDGTSDITLPNPFLVGRKWLYGLMDVSGVSTSSVATMTVDIVGVGGDLHFGLGTIHLVELPLGSIRPEDGERGLLISWPDPRNAVDEGAAAIGPTGLSALVDQEQIAATLQRWWWQLVGYEDSSPTTSDDTWYRTGSMGAINWRGTLGATYSPVFRARVRQIHSGASVVTAYVRYLAASGGKVRVIATPVGGSASNIDVTCTTSASWAIASTTATIATTGTSQMVDLEIQAEGDGGSTIYVSNVTLYTSETA
jgi:hypothetical protein